MSNPLDTNHSQIEPSPQIPLDNLPPARIRNALALKRFIRHVKLDAYIDGTDSARAAKDLANAGLIELRESFWRGLRVWEVQR